MPMNGQATGGWTEGISNFRILYVGTRNANSPLSADAFTQSNPPVVTTTSTVSTKVNTTVHGVLGGSVAFSRPDQGSNVIGGPVEGLGATVQPTVNVVGVFIDNAVGYPFMNQPSLSTGQLTYVSGMGTYGSKLYETQALATSGALTQGDDISFTTGVRVIASRNGYLMPDRTLAAGAFVSLDTASYAAERIANGPQASGSATTLGITRLVPDSVQNEVVYDARI